MNAEEDLRLEPQPIDPDRPLAGFAVSEVIVVVVFVIETPVIKDAACVVIILTSLGVSIHIHIPILPPSASAATHMPTASKTSVMRGHRPPQRLIHRVHSTLV